MGKEEKKKGYRTSFKAGPRETNKKKMGNNILLYRKEKATKEPEKTGETGRLADFVLVVAWHG